MSNLLEDDEARGKRTGIDLCDNCGYREKACVCDEPNPDVEYDY
jgi:DTW domain-containing protein YfiP